MTTPIFAIADGNFNSDIWSSTPTGSIEPGLRPDANSIVMANGHTVQLSSDITVLEWRNGDMHGATIGGYFQATTNIALGGHSYATSQHCIAFQNGGSIDGATGGINASAYGVFNLVGPLHINTVYGGAGFQAHGVYSTGPVFANEVIGGAGENAYGVFAELNCPITVTTTRGGPNVNSHGCFGRDAMFITNAYGSDVATSSYGAFGSETASNVTVNLAQGGKAMYSGGVYCYGILTVHTALGGEGEGSVGAGYGESSAIVQVAIGGSGIGAHGVYGTGIMTLTSAVSGSGRNACGAVSDSVIMITDGPLTSSVKGNLPAVAPNLILKTPITLSSFPLADDQGVIHQFVLDDGVHPEHLPSITNVRKGISYGPNNTLIGTCAVPPANKVATNIPVDQTTGTAYLLDSPTPLQTLLKIRCLDEYGAPEKDVCVSVQLIGLSTTPSTGKAFSTVVNQRLSDDQGWVITTIPRQVGLRFRAARGINPMEEDWIMFTGVDLDILEIPSFFAK